MERGGVPPCWQAAPRPPAAQSCSAGLNMGGGGRLAGGALAQWRAAPVESVEKDIQIRLNSSDLKLFQTLTAPQMSFSSYKNLK
jgi:hypothetical protein